MAILALDISGIPRQWIGDEEAISYHATNSVAWSLGDIVIRYRGGTQRSGTKSYIECSSIIAVKGHGFNPHKHNRISLTNRALFGRDRNMCAYCGKYYDNHHRLSRDHVIPRCRGGVDSWMNCVTACKECNTKKDAKLLKEAGMELLYVPYVPNHYEHVILQNRNILADQMQYLLSGVPKHSRLLS